MIVKFEPVFSEQLEYYIGYFRENARDSVVTRGKSFVEFATDRTEQEILDSLSGKTLPQPTFSEEP